MNTEKWLEDEGYPMVMSISRSSLADIILRFIHVHGLNPKEPETVHGNEAEKEVCNHVYVVDGSISATQMKCCKCGSMKPISFA